jgi:riboflavin kinase / FMN adenylyltransferase
MDRRSRRLFCHRDGAVIVARAAHELPPAERAVAIGTFDGVHRGHQAVIGAARASGLRSCVVTFHPHPREVLGYEVQLLTTYERRVELIGELRPDDALVVEFTHELARLSPEEFVSRVLEPLGTKIVLAGENFRFGHGRRGDIRLLARLGFEVRPVALVDGVSSSLIREALRAGDVRRAATMLGRPPELEGLVVSGDRRGGTLGYPTANLAVPANLLVPAYGIYAGEALGHRAALSIGVNPHYGGQERRIEAFLLEYDGDLYGTQLRVALWERLRDERSFESEQALIEQIGRDVARAREASRPV